jgi:hypothetical protein
VISIFAHSAGVPWFSLGDKRRNHRIGITSVRPSLKAAVRTWFTTTADAFLESLASYRQPRRSPAHLTNASVAASLHSLVHYNYAMRGAGMSWRLRSLAASMAISMIAAANSTNMWLLASFPLALLLPHILYLLLTLRLFDFQLTDDWLHIRSGVGLTMRVKPCFAFRSDSR